MMLAGFAKMESIDGALQREDLSLLIHCVVGIRYLWDSVIDSSADISSKHYWVPHLRA